MSHEGIGYIGLQTFLQVTFLFSKILFFCAVSLSYSHMGNIRSNILLHRSDQILS